MEVERKSSARGQIGMIDPERTTRSLGADARKRRRLLSRLENMTVALVPVQVGKGYISVTAAANRLVELHRSRAGALLVLGFQGIARPSTRARSGGDRAPVLIRRRESMCEFGRSPAAETTE